jgi:hypothetical protein
MSCLTRVFSLERHFFGSWSSLGIQILLPRTLRILSLSVARIGQGRMLFRLLQQPSQASRWGKLRGQTLVVEVRHPVFYLQNQGQGRPVSRILLYPAIHLRGIPGPLAGPRLPARRDVNAPRNNLACSHRWFTWPVPPALASGYRRWALTPPFHPSPVPRRTAAIGWSALCCT